MKVGRTVSCTHKLYTHIILFQEPRHRCALSPLLLNTVLTEVLNSGIRKIRAVRMGKEKVKLSLLADDMTAHLEHSRA